MRNLYLTGLFTISSFLALAQTFENVKATAQGDKVLITYDLVNPRTDELFAVELYGSHDNYSSPIKFVIGDVGASVKPGANKKVEWSIGAELKTYRGDITFELRGKPLIMKFNFRTPASGASVRKGKSTSIQWQGGSAMQQVRLTLHQGDRMVADVTETLNHGNYTWTVPKDMDKGKGYYLKLTAGAETVNSGSFAIKSKTPLFLKLAPFLIAGAVVPFLFGPDPPDPPDPLPGAPDPN